MLAATQALSLITRSLSLASSWNVSSAASVSVCQATLAFSRASTASLYDSSLCSRPC